MNEGTDFYRFSRKSEHPRRTNLKFCIFRPPCCFIDKYFMYATIIAGQSDHVRPIRRPIDIYGHVWAIVCPTLLNQAAPSYVTVGSP